MMLIKPKYTVDGGTIIFREEDSLSEKYIFLKPFNMVSYNYDKNKKNVIAKFTDITVNSFSIIMYDHPLLNSDFFDIPFTIIDEDPDRILWESLELFYFCVFGYAYFLRSILFENLNFKYKKKLFFFSEFEIFFREEFCYTLSFLYCSIFNRLFFLFLSV